MGNPGESWYTHLGYSGKKEPLRKKVAVMQVVTALSVWELVMCVSEHIVRMSQEKACEARTPFDAPASQPPLAAKSVASPLLIEVRVPELPCAIRRPRDASDVALVTFDQTPSPDIDNEYRALASQLPALEPPLRASYATEAEWLADCRAYRQTWDAWREAHPADWRSAYDRACDRQRALAAARQQPRKTFTVAVRLHGRAPRVPKKVMKGIRAAETWRFDPERHSPLEEALANDKPIVHLKAKGKFEEAAALEASTSQLVAQMERWPDVVQQRRQDRRPWAMKDLWIEPGVTTRQDTQFELVLRLCQERMIEYPPEIARFVDGYMKQFKYAFTRDERHDLQQGIALGGGEGFAEILRTDACPESAKGRRQYFARTLHGRRATAARQEAEQSGQWLTVSPRSDGLYSVDDAVRILAREAPSGQWTPPRDWLYDRINTGVLPVVCDTQGRKCLDEHGVQYARKLVKDENDRMALVEYQMDTLGKSRRAANKFIQEHENRGESLEDIAKALLSQGKGPLYPKQQRGSDT